MRLIPASHYDQLIGSTARRYGLEPALVKAIVRCESDFDPWAVSPRGAQGLMQLMPTTQTLLGVTDVFDPQHNIRAGVRYLAMLRQTFGNDIALLLAAYNAGPQAVIAAGYTVPPAAETQRYLRCVLAARDAYRQQGINTRFASIPEAQVSVDGEPDILVGSLRLSPRVARVGQRITVSLEVQYRGNTAIQGTVMLTYPEPLVSFVALRTSERRTIVRLPSSQGREALQALWGAPAYQFLQSSWSAWQPGQRRSAVLALVPRLLQDLALHLSVFVYDATETTVRYRWSTVVRIPVRSRTW